MTEVEQTVLLGSLGGFLNASRFSVCPGAKRCCSGRRVEENGENRVEKARELAEL
jgi:hypothetical protein